MDVHEKRQSTGKVRVMHTVLSIFVIAVAVGLLIYMVTVEGELGALPLLLLASGIAWLLVARLRIRPRRG